MEEITNKMFCQQNMLKNCLSPPSYYNLHLFYQNALKMLAKENLPIMEDVIKNQQERIYSDIVLTQQKDDRSLIFEHQGLEFRVLTKRFRNPALELLSQEFADQEPLSKAFCQQFPQQKSKMKSLWVKAWDFFIDQSIQEGLGVVIVDQNKNEKVVGFSLATTKAFQPDLEEKLLKDFTVFPFNVAFETMLLDSVDEKNKAKLEQTELIVDILAVALDKKYMGRRLLPKMIEANQILAKEYGCKYSYVFASNFKTGIALGKLNYQKMTEYPCKEFEFKGIRPYAMIQELQERPSLWIKDL